jgi:hypothetical protein
VRQIGAIYKRNSRRAALMKSLAPFSFCFVTLLFCSGCATNALWEEGTFARFHEPATPSKLELFENAKEKKMLIVYEEGNDENSAVHLRAYWTDPLASPPINSFRPKFVSPKNAKGLAQIPIGAAAVPTGYSATLTNETHAFLLFKDASNVGFFDLPVYADASGRAKQIALTPLAVVADLTILGGFVFIWYWAGRAGAEYH